jgi:hypothetical protein
LYFSLLLGDIANVTVAASENHVLRRAEQVVWKGKPPLGMTSEPSYHPKCFRLL